MRKRRLLSITFILLAILFILHAEHSQRSDWPEGPDHHRNGRPVQLNAVNNTASETRAFTSTFTS
jgi:hypothetical protein